MQIDPNYLITAKIARIIMLEEGKRLGIMATTNPCCEISLESNSGVLLFGDMKNKEIKEEPENW